MLSDKGKDFAVSKTTIGFAITVVSNILRSHGIELGDFVDVVGLEDSLPDIIGGILFTWGQIKRKEKITSFFGYKLTKETGE